MATITIKSNASQGSDVLVRDIGLIVPASGATTLTFTDASNIDDIRGSDDLRTLVSDAAFGAGQSTLQVGDGTNFYTTLGVEFLNMDMPIFGLATASDTQTTTSATYVAIPNMSISGLAPGRYYLHFTATLGNSGATNQVDVQFYDNGVALTASAKTVDTLAANYRVIMSSSLVTTSTTVIFTARWQTSGGTATIINRGFVALWLGA